MLFRKYFKLNQITGFIIIIIANYISGLSLFDSKKHLLKSVIDVEQGNAKNILNF